MKLNNWQRILKLAGGLSKSPHYIPRYLRFHPIRKMWPVEVELPWWSFGAIDFVEKRLRRDHQVFEYGSGGSTLFFASRCAAVRCIESEAEWRDIVVQRLQKANRSNVAFDLASLNFQSEAEVDGSPFITALDRPYDVIVVDGQDFGGQGIGRRFRPASFERAERFVREGGMIIVDDSWRLTELRQRNRAKRVHAFESVGPCRMGVTCTDVYEY